MRRISVSVSSRLNFELRQTTLPFCSQTAFSSLFYINEGTRYDFSSMTAFSAQHEIMRMNRAFKAFGGSGSYDSGA